MVGFLEVLIDLLEDVEQTLLSLRFQLFGHLNEVLPTCLQGRKFTFHQVKTGLTFIVLLNRHHVDIAKVLHLSLKTSQFSLKFTDVLETLWKVLKGEVRFNEFLAHQLNLCFLIGDGTHQFIGKTAMVLSLVEALFVAYSKGGSLVGEVLTLLLKALIFFKVNGLFILLRLERHAVGGQRRLEFIHPFHTGFLVLMKNIQALLCFINTALKNSLMARTTGNDLFRFFLVARGADSEKTCRMHAFPEMFRAGGFQGRLGLLVRFPCDVERTVCRIKSTKRILRLDANFVECFFEPVHDLQGFFVGEADLLFLGFEFPQFGCVRVVHHGVDSVSNVLLICACLTKGFVDRCFHQVVFLNLCRVLLDFAGTLDASTKGDAHFSL